MPSPSLLLYLTFVIFHAGNVSAGILYQSGLLGPTEIPRLDVSSQIIPGTNISHAVFNGARFELTQPATVTGIGGHFVGPFSAENFFGAIVHLSDANDFPDSNNLSTPDVLGNTILTFPEPSAEVLGDLELSLQPGWYAVVFGSGLFGATGKGAAVRNNVDLNDPHYLTWQLGSQGDGWFNSDELAPGFSGNLRLVVEGTVVPEPSCLAIATCGLLTLSQLLRAKLPTQGTSDRMLELSGDEGAM